MIVDFLKDPDGLAARGLGLSGMIEVELTTDNATVIRVVGRLLWQPEKPIFDVTFAVNPHGITAPDPRFALVPSKKDPKGGWSRWALHVNQGAVGGADGGLL